MAFHMLTQYDAPAEQHQNAVPAPTYGLFHVVDQPVHNAPSNLSAGPPGVTDPLSGLLFALTLGESTPQVPAQPQQDLAVEQVQHADTQDEFHPVDSSRVEVRDYQRVLQRFFRKRVQQAYTVEVQQVYTVEVEGGYLVEH
ncbi:hypothetical protein FRC08_007873 [Ceratobasidium sp. 394]|nr:hypothetical protein FRC08_007873 [Ceratobasidium sp. 394]